MEKMDLENLNWSFSKELYTDIKKFEKALRQKNKDIEESNWKPNAKAFEVAELQIEYMCYIESPKDLLANEYLSESDQNVFEEYPDEESHQVEIYAKLKADNNTFFTAIEFLFKAHNQQANKELGDHVFFEGTDTEPIIINGLPNYFIATGS